MHKADAHDLDPTRAPSVFNIDVLRIARIYAAALLRAAEAKGIVDDLQEAFDSLVGNPLRASDDPSDPATIMASGAIPRARKAEVIEKLFRGKADDLFVNFLQVLNNHNRLDIIRPVAAMYRELRDDLYNRVRVLVRSAVPLPDDQRQRLLRQLRQDFGKEPVLHEKVDPSLLGGMVVRIGDWVYDASVRTRLETLRNELIERSSHEIQSRRDRFYS